MLQYREYKIFLAVVSSDSMCNYLKNIYYHWAVEFSVADKLLKLPGFGGMEITPG